MVKSGAWQEWIAWAGLVVPLATLAWAAIRYTGTEQLKRKRETDERIQQLAEIIYNRNGEFGQAAQLLAIDELATFSGRRRAITRAVIAMRQHFESVAPGSPLTAAFDDLLMELKK